MLDTSRRRTDRALVGGTRLGSYQLLERIGVGGMGEVALKVLHPLLSRQREIVDRFFNEARAAAALADPGIVQVFDFGNHTDGSAFLVMELLAGETLDARIRSRGVLPTADAVRIVRQVASSLGSAHACNIIHRDLKPENIFLVRDPEVPGGERAKLLDFGIAKIVGDSHVKTQTSVIMGTPTFMSPEQCRGGSVVDRRSDVYSLGCVLFASIAGHPPFAATGAGELIAMHLHEPAPRLSSVVPGIDALVDDLVARCLEKDPDRRFATATELADTMAALPSRPHVVAVTLAPTLAPSPPSPTTLSAGVFAIPRRRRSRRQLGLVTAVTVMLGVGWVAFASQRSSDVIATDPVITAPRQPERVDARSSHIDELLRIFASWWQTPITMSPIPTVPSTPRRTPPSHVTARQQARPAPTLDDDGIPTSR